jgi:hypothetical protein
MRSLDSRHLEVCAFGQCRARLAMSWIRIPRPGATRSRHPPTLPTIPRSASASANSCRCLHQAGRISRVLRLGSSKVSDKKTLSTNISAMFYVVKAAVAHMSSGSRPTVYRRPARTFVLPAPRVPETAGQRGADDLIPDNGQVERMNRTIKDATVKRYFYETHDQLRAHLQNFVDAYNFARRLKTLRGLTPYEFICKAWTSEPHRFKISPLQQMPGLNI